MVGINYHKIPIKMILNSVNLIDTTIVQCIVLMISPNMWAISDNIQPFRKLLLPAPMIFADHTCASQYKTATMTLWAS